MKKMDGHLISLLNPASFEADQYRVLRHKLEWLQVNKGFSLIAVSSSTLGDAMCSSFLPEYFNEEQLFPDRTQRS